MVAPVSGRAAQDDLLWQKIWSCAGQGAAALNQLRQELRDRTAQSLPEPVRRLLTNWQTAVRVQACRHAAAQIPLAFRLLERQRRAWEQACRRASKHNFGLLGRWRCLQLGRRHVALERELERARLGAATAQKSAEHSLVRGTVLRMQVERHLGAFVSQTEGGRHPSTAPRAAVVRSLERHLACDLERYLASLLEERCRVLSERMAHLQRQLEAAERSYAEGQHLLRSRGDTLLLMRQHYEIRRHEWPSQAIERALLGALGEISDSLGVQHQALVNEGDAIRFQLHEARQRLLLRMERVSRFVVPEATAVNFNHLDSKRSSHGWSTPGLFAPSEVPL